MRDRRRLPVLPTGGARARAPAREQRRRGLDPALRREPARRRRTSICSSFDDDIAAHAADGGEHAAAAATASAPTSAPTRTLAWCNRFDEGESFREIVRNVAGRLRAHVPVLGVPPLPQRLQHRRLRQDALLGRRLGILQNIYQNLLFRTRPIPAFRSRTGAFGFYDQFLATTDILNFYAQGPGAAERRRLPLQRPAPAPTSVASSSPTAPDADLAGAARPGPLLLLGLPGGPVRHRAHRARRQLLRQDARAAAADDARLVGRLHARRRRSTRTSTTCSRTRCSRSSTA